MTAFATSIAERDALGEWHLIIDGLPDGFGTISRDSSWFGTDSWRSVKDFAREDSIPTFTEQRLNLREGRIDSGTASVTLVDHDDTLAGILANNRRDDWLRLTDDVTSVVTSWTVEGDATNYTNTSTTVTGSGSTDTVIDVVDASGFSVGDWVDIVSEWRVVAAVDTGTNQITLEQALGLGAPAAATNVYRGGVAYCGRETVLYRKTSSTTLTVKRGMFGSEAEQHSGRNNTTGSDQQAEGDIVSLYPRFFAGRRCRILWGMDAESESDTVVAFAGSIFGASWDDLGQSVVVEIDDFSTELRKTVFRHLDPANYQIAPITARFTSGITAPGTWGNVAFVEGIQDPGTDVEIDLLLDGVQSTRTTHTRWVVTLKRTTTTQGASRMYTHLQTLAVDRTGQIVYIPNSRSRPLTTELSAASSMRRVELIDRSRQRWRVGNSADEWEPTHALDIVARLIMSTDGGSNGTYDTLPDLYGLGIPAERVDTSGFAELIALTDMPVSLIVEEPVQLQEFAHRILRPFGGALRPTWPASIGAYYLSEPGPDEITGATTIGTGEIAFSGGALDVAGPQLSIEQAVSGIEWREYADESQPVRYLVTAQDIYRDPSAASEPVQVDASIIDRGRDRRGANDVEWDIDLALFREDLLARIQRRLGTPPFTLIVGCYLEQVTLSVGDLVSVTLENFPSQWSATRGLSSQIFEVWGKGPVDLATGVVKLRLVQSGVGLDPVRYIAPSLIVSSFADDTPSAGKSTLTVQQNAFTPGSGVDDTDAFATGNFVRVYSADMDSESAEAEIEAVNPTTVQINLNASTLGLTPASGYVVEFSDTTGILGDVGVSEATRNKYAFKAGNDRLIPTGSGSTAVDGHTHG